MYKFSQNSSFRLVRLPGNLPTELYTKLGAGKFRDKAPLRALSPQRVELRHAIALPPGKSLSEDDLLARRCLGTG